MSERFDCIEILLMDAGSCQRRAHLALPHHSPPRPRRLLGKADHLPDPIILRHRARPPPLRVSHNASANAAATRGGTLCLPVHVYVLVRLFRRIRVPSHWKCVLGDTGTQLLQLDGTSTILRTCWGGSG